MDKDEMKGEGVLQYGRSAQQVIDTAGDKTIQKIIVKRSPVPKLLTGALSAFSLGKFGKRMYKNFDELFHSTRISWKRKIKLKRAKKGRGLFFF